LICILFVPWFAQAQTDGRQTTHGKQTVRAIPTENPLVVDGDFSEPAWREATAASGFLQRDPAEGGPATENTEFKVVYTPSVLYIGVTSFDSDPAAIIASERQRDGNLGNDDNVSIVLDTFHDHRNSFRFQTNPLGTQADALITDEGNNTTEDWDERWEVASRITEAGWTAEFAIPFKSLRVPESADGMVWGLDISRFIRRKNESTFWTNYRRGFDLSSMSQSGHMVGLEGIQTGLIVRAKPYVLTGFSQTSDQAQSSACRDTKATGPTGTGSAFCDASNAGMEMKYRITPSLTADLTWRTDFAQTEVDNQEVNLDRFPLFFPEKREFFQEGAGIFEFGIAQNEQGGAATKLFHSRQIGLSPRRQPVPIVGGARVTGRLMGLTLGILNVQTEQFGDELIPASNYSVFRAKRDVLARSTLGTFFINRETGGGRVLGIDGLLTDDYNRVFGADANFVFFKYFTVGGVLANSSDPKTRGDDWMSAGVVKWDSDFFHVETSWLVVDPNFRDDLGFVPRKDRRDINPTIEFRPRPRDNKWIRQFILRGRMEYIMNSKNVLQTRTNHTIFEIRFQSGDTFGWAPHTRFDTFSRPFTNRQGVWEIPPGSYSWWYNSLRYGLNPSRRISGQIINWTHHIGYYGGGTLHDISISPRVRFTNKMSATVSYSINKASFPARMCVDQTESSCGFTDHVVNSRLNYNFNNQWLTSTTLQYNNADHVWGVNLRLNYIYRTGDNFFVIYNEGRHWDDEDGISTGPNDRKLQIKFTRSFDY
jgi:hypothetical protein